MRQIYLVTGAAGHLGNVLTQKLVLEGQRVWVFLLNGEENRVEGVERVFYGDVCDRKSLEDLFTAAQNETMILIHCAGIVSITSHFFQRLYDVNVNGTKNIVDLCVKHGVQKLLYVSSVHAIPENHVQNTIRETEQFDPDLVVGHYAKTKAEATKYVLEARRQGLTVNVVHPSGIIGPYDYGKGHMTAMILDYCKGHLVAGMEGGYDFVDVRDVADGILASCEKGRPGECYILCNRYYTIKELLNELCAITGKKRIKTYLPLWLVRWTAPLSELYYRLLNRPPLFTDYSIYTLTTNQQYSHEKATLELGYQPRGLGETLKDTFAWLKDTGRL